MIVDASSNLLRNKHSKMQNAQEEVLLQGPIKQVHPVVYQAINEVLLSKAALKTKGGCDPSGFDTDLCESNTEN